MPGTRCAVYGCNNTYKKRKESSKHFMFHRFPNSRDFFSIRQEWIVRCKRQDNWNPDTSYICSFHFDENDYERDLQNELLGLPLRNILKKTAVPTLELYNKKSGETNTSRTTIKSERMLKRKNKEEVVPLHGDKDKDYNTNQEPSEEAISELSSASEPDWKPEIPDYEIMYAELLHKYKDLKQKYNLLKSRNGIKNKKKLKS